MALVSKTRRQQDVTIDVHSTEQGLERFTLEVEGIVVRVENGACYEVDVSQGVAFVLKEWEEGAPCKPKVGAKIYLEQEGTRPSEKFAGCLPFPRTLTDEEIAMITERKVHYRGENRKYIKDVPGSVAPPSLSALYSIKVLDGLNKNEVVIKSDVNVTWAWKN